MTEENRVRRGGFVDPGAEKVGRILHSSATKRGVRELKVVISVNRNLVKC